MVAVAVLVPWLAWLIVSFLSLYLLSLLAHARSGLPPGPSPLPLIGSIHLLGDKPHRSLARLAKIHSPLMSIRLGTVTTVVISSPAMAREFLQRHGCLHGLTPPASTRLAPSWLPPVQRWRALRKIMATELFAPQRLDALHHLRSDKVRELTDHVARLARDGTAVNIGRVAFTTSLNLVSRTIFSIDLTSLDDHGRSKEFQEVITGIMEGLGAPNVSDFFPVLEPADLQGMRCRLARLFARLDAVFDAEVDQRLRDRDACQPRKNDYLDVLLDVAASEDGKDLLDRETLRSHFTELFAAGSDTNSSTVEWAMAELLQNQSSMAKVCDELAQVIGAIINIEEADIARLPYLQAVIKETLRLHPPTPLLLPRQPKAMVKIEGYTITMGSHLFINV
ncbi:hypothetical protein CFC21_026373 [Triticum aestivum]|uniref:Cytochrome P450 n=2 Tax=Triticum aestivum TaxID=4565 RepID=A0A3B6CG50_WHEAT|nr:hypothetical protein CFC21_026373 [Triticum aestivum]